MRAFLIRVGLFLGLLAGLLGWVAFAVEPDAAEVSFLSGYRDKTTRLEQRDRPGVILVGGSNVAFGFDNPRMSRQIGRPVINMGLHADLGARAMLRQIDPHLVRGDHVVLIFEPDLWTGDAGGSAALAALMIDVDRSVATSMTAGQCISNFDDVVLYLGRKVCARVGKAFNSLLGRRPPPGAEAIYRRDGFNESGDLTSHWDIEPIAYVDLPTPRSNAVDEPTFDFVADWVADARRRGIDVALLPPVMERSASVRYQGLWRSIESGLDRYGLAYAVSRDAFIVDRSDVFDTPYHLRRDAVLRRTDQVAEILSDAE